MAIIAIILGASFVLAILIFIYFRYIHPRIRRRVKTKDKESFLTLDELQKTRQQEKDEKGEAMKIENN